MEYIANWLKKKQKKIAACSPTRSAQQIPLELLPRIHRLIVGQGLVIQGPQSITLMRIAAAQSIPVTEDVALPRIQQFLGNQRAAEAAKEDLKTLKAKAKITYMGEFSHDVAAPSAAAPAVARVTDITVPQSNADIALEKGAAGLK
jgi:hypothetical protein